MTMDSLRRAASLSRAHKRKQQYFPMLRTFGCRFIIILPLLCGAGIVTGQTTSVTEAGTEQKRLQEERRRFQSQELATAKPFSFIFNPGAPPGIVWRDADEARRLGCVQPLRVRWFDADLNEVTTPTRPGRTGAYIETTAPNGTPFRRAMTFFCRPPFFLVYMFPGLRLPVAYQPGPIPEAVWNEHKGEISRTSRDLFLRSFNDSEAGAILMAGLSGTKALGRPAAPVDSAEVLNEDYQLALKLKLQGLKDKARPLKPPRKRSAGPAPILHKGAMAEAGMRPDARAKIDAVCQAWAKDTSEPFTVLVARRGVIVIHKAYGRDTDRRRIGLDYRCDVASITKFVTSVLFTLFLDQGLIGLDDPVGTILPDFPATGPYAMTFRQCFTHTSGLSGHGDWGGMRNPQFENVILNGIDALEPGKSYNYSGLGLELAAKAMEAASGKSAMRLYEEDLFRPLGIGGIPMGSASAGACLTAWDLGVLAQWLANRGSYGEMEFVSPQTCGKMLPVRLDTLYPGITQEEGLGQGWQRDLKPGSDGNSTRTKDLIFSPRTLGHGSLSGCILRVDLDRELVVVQIRKQHGERYANWATKLFLTVTDCVRE